MPPELSSALFGLNVIHVSSWRTTLVSLLLGYVLTQVVAWVYARTFRGLSYSRSMVQALVVGGVVSAMVMIAIGDSLARGIGIVGTLALIRFRTNLRDPLDMIFVFAAFGAGIAAGTGAYAAAILGTGVFVVVVTMTRVTGFGARTHFDGVVRLTLPLDRAAAQALEAALRQHCRRFALITLREVSQGTAQEHAYQIALNRPETRSALVANLNAIPGASGVSLAMQEATVEL